MMTPRLLSLDSRRLWIKGVLAKPVQGTDSRLNTATAILRAMIYLLASEQPFLISHLRKKYDHAGRKLFEDSGAFYSLSDVFQ
jgi:hypothetical protein